MAEAEKALISEPTPPSAGMSPPGLTLAQIVQTQIETLREHHRAVLESEAVEAVHKMRVTTRRLQASLDLLEEEMHAPKLKRRLRKWRRALSQVRNYDVFLHLLDEEATGRRRRTHREQFQLVKSLLQERRVRKAAKVRQFLENIDIDVIASSLRLDSVAAEHQDIDATQETQFDPIQSPPNQIDERKVAAYAAERLDQRLAEFQALVAQSHPTTDPTELHQLRIAAKRVRYLLEVVRQMGFGDGTRALAWLRTLQDRIGDWHDLEALEEEIIEITSSRKFLKQHLAESGRILQAAAHLQKKKEALVSKLFPVRVPRTLILTAQRTAKALRREAMRKQTETPAVNNA